MILVLYLLVLLRGGALETNKWLSGYTVCPEQLMDHFTWCNACMQHAALTRCLLDVGITPLMCVGRTCHFTCCCSTCTSSERRQFIAGSCKSVQCILKRERPVCKRCDWSMVGTLNGILAENDGLSRSGLMSTEARQRLAMETKGQQAQLGTGQWALEIYLEMHTCKWEEMAFSRPAAPAALLISDNCPMLFSARHSGDSSLALKTVFSELFTPVCRLSLACNATSHTVPLTCNKCFIRYKLLKSFHLARLYQ